MLFSMLFEVIYTNIYRCLGGGVGIHVYVCQQMAFLMQKNEKIKNSATCMYIWLCMITFFWYSSIEKDHLVVYQLTSPLQCMKIDLASH